MGRTNSVFFDGLDYCSEQGRTGLVVVTTTRRNRRRDIARSTVIVLAFILLTCFCYHEDGITSQLAFVEWWNSPCCTLDTRWNAYLSCHTIFALTKSSYYYLFTVTPTVHSSNPAVSRSLHRFGSSSKKSVEYTIIRNCREYLSMPSGTNDVILTHSPNILQRLVLIHKIIKVQNTSPIVLSYHEQQQATKLHQ